MTKTFMIRGESPSHTSPTTEPQVKGECWACTGRREDGTSIICLDASTKSTSGTCYAHTVRHSSGASKSLDEAAEKGRKAGGEACSFASVSNAGDRSISR